jgi:hypothetical protein
LINIFQIIFCFIQGFKNVITSRNFCNIQFQILQDFINLNIKYNISDDTPNSLKNNLQTRQKFKEKFIKVLDYLNYNHPKKLEKFIKFWFGCNKYTFNCNISISHNYKCNNYFKSHTCFNQLEFNTNILNHDDILKAIDCSLLNQEISTNAGLSIQDY